MVTPGFPSHEKLALDHHHVHLHEKRVHAPSVLYGYLILIMPFWTFLRISARQLAWTIVKHVLQHKLVHELLGICENPGAPVRLEKHVRELHCHIDDLLHENTWNPQSMGI